MSVWVVFPSKRPHAEVEAVLARWREQGYNIGLWRDPGDEEGFEECLFVRKYEGYAVAANALVQKVFEFDSGCDWVVVAGDDILPDPNKRAEEIADECSMYFGTRALSEQARAAISAGTVLDLTTDPCAHPGPAHSFGVLQPTGDRWGDHERHMGKTGSAYIDRVCGSPWIGREFARRMYQGQGPYWPTYVHQFVDEELQCVAEKHGVLWQRRDLTHRHEHWARKRSNTEDMPTFLAEANSRKHWAKYKAIFEARKAAGFPGSEPLL